MTEATDGQEEGAKTEQETEQEILQAYISDMSVTDIIAKFGVSEETLHEILKTATEEDNDVPEKIGAVDVLRAIERHQDAREHVSDEVAAATLEDKANKAILAAVGKQIASESTEVTKTYMTLAKTLDNRYGAVAGSMGMPLLDFVVTAVEFFLEHGNDFPQMDADLNKFKTQRDELARILYIKNYKAELISKVTVLSVLTGQKLNDTTFESLMKVMDRGGL